MVARDRGRGFDVCVSHRVGRWRSSQRHLRCRGAAAAGAAQPGVQTGHTGAGDGSAYFVDSMFRSSTNFVDGDKTAPRAEATRILIRNIQDGSVVLSPADKAYMAQMVVARTDLSLT